jgi:ATP-dependent Clp protease ATP-binding subunit ClpA
LKAKEAEGGHVLLKEEVTEEDIAKVVSAGREFPSPASRRESARSWSKWRSVSWIASSGRNKRSGLSNAVRRARRPAGRKSPHRFLHVSRPTGVGKTELSKALAVLFDDERARFAST